MPAPNDYWKDPEKHRNKSRAYYEANREICLEKMRRYSKKNRERIKARGVQYREENKEKLQQQQKEYYRRNREVRLASAKKWRTQNPLARRKRNLAQYGLTLESFEILLKKQQGRCAICSRIPHQFHVDHNHACCSNVKRCCGKCVRGLLCANCNTGLGCFFDNSRSLEKAAKYLQSPPFQV